MKSLEWRDGELWVLDQTRLPGEVEWLKCRTPRDVARAIKEMKVRGAPAIGLAAAYGVVLAAYSFPGGAEGEDTSRLTEALEEAQETLAATRPTAVNLFWALERMQKVWENNREQSFSALKELLLEEAMAIEREDLARNRKMGRMGSTLVPRGAVVLTHCNAGALATGGYGTALGVIRAAHEEGKVKQVYACETRPLLQGARLTAWELTRENIPVTVVTDNAAGYLMKQGKIHLVVVGADRVTAGGDVANKIGTYGLAVLAKYHKIPFYVAAPLSTFDLSLTRGEEIPIEERAPAEVRGWGSIRFLPEEAGVYNPAFDVTPADLITAIVTEEGVLRPPYGKTIGDLFR